MGPHTSDTSMQLLSRIAIDGGHGEDSPYFDGWKAYESNPYHATKNPSGVIQMGLAENQLSFDLIRDWIKKNPEASICTDEGVDAFKDIANFQDYHGLPKFRQGVAKFMRLVRGGRVTFDPDRIVMSGGATGANENIMSCLANPGDAFLVPTPYYPAFDRDLKWRTGVRIIPVSSDSSNDFKITKESVEEAYANAQAAKIRVKGILIANPSNPLGTVLDKDTLKTLVTFVNDKNIHLVCDEIYAATVFRSPEFISVAEVIKDMEHCNHNLIHIIYSLSKDMGLPGFRVGIVYSYNDTVVSCARRMSSFGLVSSQTQHLLASMLSDEEFTANFVVENGKRLGDRHKVVTDGLAQLGIKCLKSNAGLFCWMDLRPMLKEATVEGEMELWRAIIKDVKLNVSPGSSFHCSEPGWFRVCFANMDDQMVDVALKRINKFVRQEGREEEEELKPAKKKRWQNAALRLSFSARRYDEPILTPHMMSPHSPMPHSPLVRAMN